MVLKGLTAVARCPRPLAARRARRGPRARRPRPARRPQGPAALGRREREARLRRVEGRSSSARACPTTPLDRLRPGPRRDADRRAAGRLRGQPRALPGRDPGHRRPRAPGHQPRRHDELPLGAERRRVGDAGEVRAHVRHPPAERLHGADARRTASRRLRAGLQDGVVGHTHSRREARRSPTSRARSPIANDDPAARRDVRLPGAAGPGRRRLADAARRARATPPCSGIYTHPETVARRWS